MSLEIQDVFQFLKEMTFQRILIFYNSLKLAILVVSVRRLNALRLVGEVGPGNLCKGERRKFLSIRMR
jgi:hypothetical protein